VAEIGRVLMVGGVFCAAVGIRQSAGEFTERRRQPS
jgi:hypothetical protein